MAGRLSVFTGINVGRMSWQLTAWAVCNFAAVIAEKAPVYMATILPKVYHPTPCSHHATDQTTCVTHENVYQQIRSTEACKVQTGGYGIYAG